MPASHVPIPYARARRGLGELKALLALAQLLFRLLALGDVAAEAGDAGHAPVWFDDGIVTVLKVNAGALVFELDRASGLDRLPEARPARLGQFRRQDLVEMLANDVGGQLSKTPQRDLVAHEQPALGAEQPDRLLRCVQNPPARSPRSPAALPAPGASPVTSWKTRDRAGDPAGGIENGGGAILDGDDAAVAGEGGRCDSPRRPDAPRAAPAPRDLRRV